MVVLGLMFSSASVSPRPNPVVVHGHASMGHHSWCFVPLSTALAMKSVTVVRFAAEEFCARRCLARDAATSIKLWLGTLKNRNLSKSRVLDAKAMT